MSNITSETINTLVTSNEGVSLLVELFDSLYSQIDAKDGVIKSAQNLIDAKDSHIVALEQGISELNDLADAQEKLEDSSQKYIAGLVAGNETRDVLIGLLKQQLGQ